MARGKRYRAAYEKIDRTHAYLPAEAISLVKQTAEKTKFDQTIEVHMRLGVNVRHAEEQLRGTLALPHGLGKDVRVAVFAEGDAARAAQVRQIAERKMPDLNANDLDAASRIIAGTARSMGVDVEGLEQ